MNDADAPDEVRVTPRGAALVLTWANGASSQIAAAALRRACRCGDCTAARAVGKTVLAEGDVAITAIETLGGYAVNIAFSDGHARGIYPWDFLCELAGL